MQGDYDYDVTLSFAGEDRQVVEALAARLKQQNVSVFYDRDKQGQLWGENLQEVLTEVYLKQARFCVMFISRAYAEKMWTREERRAAVARAMKEKRAYILPIKLDHTELEGLLPSVAYINYSDHSEDEIVAMILEKLDAGESRRPSTPTQAPSLNIAMPRVKKSFSQREKDVFAREGFDTIRGYFEQGLAQLQQHDPDVQADFELLHRAKFLCRVYVKGELANACKIWIGGGKRGSDDRINYYEGTSIDRDQDNQTSGDSLNVATDGNVLGFSSGYGFGGYVGGSGHGNEERFFPPDRAAQMLWARLSRLSASDRQ